MVFTFQHDPMNKEGRNSRNTYLCDYNCGGYALGTFNWFCPYGSYAEDTLYGKRSKETTLKNFTKYILLTFEERIRIISKVEEKTNDEYVIAFRIGYEDFHFMKRGDNGIWYHKPGSNTIRRIKKTEVFSEVWYTPNGYTRYDSEIILFAMKK